MTTKKTGSAMDGLAEAVRRLGITEDIAQAAAAVGATEADARKALACIEQLEETGVTVLSYVIAGDPPVSKRPRSVRLRNGSGDVVGIRTYAADGDMQESILEAVRRRTPEGHIPFAGEVEVQIRIYQQPPKSFPVYRQLLAELGYIRVETKPDVDNRMKILLDAMRGVVYTDDNIIVRAEIVKYYSIRPRVEIDVAGRRQRLTK